MKTIIPAIALFAGVAAALLQILDWSTSKDQKAAITDRLIDGWIWLEEQRWAKFIPRVWSRGVQITLFVCYMVPATYYLLRTGHYYLTERPKYPERQLTEFIGVALSLTLLVSLIIAYFAFHRRIMRNVREMTTLPRYVGYIAVNAIVFSLTLPVQLLFTVLCLWVPWLLVVVILAVPLVVEASILWSLAVFSVGWLGLMWFVARILKTLSFLLDRALSQEKGVLAGAAVLFVVIAVLARALL